MKNLNYEGVREIDSNELRNINGGAPWLIAIATGVVIGVTVATAAAIFDDWKNFKAGLLGEPEIPRN